MAQQIKITQSSNADINIGVPKNLTAVKWLVQWLEDNPISYGNSYNKAIEQAKAMEKEQRGYTEEQAKEIWKAGQEYWKTSGSSITFEELIDKFKNK
jgi:hypothetical protein